MSVMGDSAILKQSKKAQGETNDRLDMLIQEQRRTNELLGQLLAVVQAGGAEAIVRPASWGRQV